MNREIKWECPICHDDYSEVHLWCRHLAKDHNCDTEDIQAFLRDIFNGNVYPSGEITMKPIFEAAGKYSNRHSTIPEPIRSIINNFSRAVPPKAE